MKHKRDPLGALGPFLVLLIIVQVCLAKLCQMAVREPATGEPVSSVRQKVFDIGTFLRTSKGLLVTLLISVIVSVAVIILFRFLKSRNDRD
jgi:hypothetical protein